MKTIFKTVVSIIFFSQSIFLCGQNYYQEQHLSNDIFLLEEVRDYGTLNGSVYEHGLANMWMTSNGPHSSGPQSS